MLFGIIMKTPKILHTLQENVGPCLSCDGWASHVCRANQLTIFSVPVWTYPSHEVLYCRLCRNVLSTEMYESVCAPLMQVRIYQPQTPTRCHRCGHDRNKDAQICPQCKQTFLSVRPLVWYLLVERRRFHRAPLLISTAARIVFELLQRWFSFRSPLPHFRLSIDFTRFMLKQLLGCEMIHTKNTLSVSIVSFTGIRPIEMWVFLMVNPRSID